MVASYLPYEMRALATFKHDLARFADVDAPIDAAGVGTRHGDWADAPCIDSVCELVPYDSRPTTKLLKGKTSLPGPEAALSRPGASDQVGRGTSRRRPARRRSLRRQCARATGFIHWTCSSQLVPDSKPTSKNFRRARVTSPTRSRYAQRSRPRSHVSPTR
jgi:hypothetical protein